MDPITIAALLAAGLAANQYGQHQSDKAQKNAAWKGLEEETRLREEAQAKTEKFAEENFDPTKRLQAYQAGIDQSASQGVKAVGAVDLTDAGGATGDAYARAKAQATSESAQRARDLAMRFARQGGMTQLATRDKLASTDLSGDMLGINAATRRNRMLTDMAVQRGANKGRGWKLAGDLMMGYATGGVGGAAAGAAGNAYSYNNDANGTLYSQNGSQVRARR